MNCPKCGRMVEDGAAVCRCGANLDQWRKESDPELLSVAAEQAWKEALERTPMKWYKFLIYFALFASALLNLLYAGVSCAMGVRGTTIGFVLVAVYAFLAVFSIITRFRLAAYKRNAPQMVIWLYLLNLLAGILPLVITGTAIPWTTVIAQVIGTSVIVALNGAYFANRKSIFIK